MRRFWAVLFCVSAALIPSCLSIPPDPSLEFGPNADWRVTNGTAYEHGTLSVGSASVIVLPEDAVVRRSAAGGNIDLYLAKQLGFMGHPVEHMSIRKSRKEMGCAAMSEGRSLFIATYGEWDCIEGGAAIRLVAVVPANLAIEQRKGLSGKDSLDWDKVEFAEVASMTSWRAIPTLADPHRTAKE